jgi:L-aspartate oxidase
VRVPPVRYLPYAKEKWRRETDVVVVGAGAAGLSAALEVARLGRRVIILSKSGPQGGSTPLAQGGLAAATDPDDSIALHEADTLLAGAGLADEEAVRELVSSASGAIRYLAELGVRFDDGPPGLEGGHSRRRIVHAGGDAIGAEIHRALYEAVVAADIEIMHLTVAIDAVKDTRGRVVGVIAATRNGPKDEEMHAGIILAHATIIASGGFGQVFMSSTNPPDLTGDGLALCSRAGAKLSNVEFVQFHPTVLHVGSRSGQSSLLTEALRGAGARILDADGQSVMDGHHALGDLAPRDIVAYRMFQRINEADQHVRHLWLDATMIGEQRLLAEFPTAVELCRRAGLNLAGAPVPISPGAHYACGGVLATSDGVTSVPGLFAIGEVASTGVHGANRLASNSLSEAVVGGRRIAHYLLNLLSAGRVNDTSGEIVRPAAGTGIDASWRGQLARAMSRNVGVVRNKEGLTSMLETLDETPRSVGGSLSIDLVEATNLHTVSLLVTCAATLRTESRGCHRRSDYPNAVTAWRRPILLSVKDGNVLAHESSVASS